MKIPREKLLYYTVTLIVPEPLLSQKLSSLPFTCFPEYPGSIQSIIYDERKKVRGEHQHIVMWCIFFHNCIYHCYIMAVEKKGRFHDPTWRRDQFEWMTWCMITRVTWHINERHLSEWKCAATSNRQPTSLHIMDIYQTTRHNALFTTL